MVKKIATAVWISLLLLGRSSTGAQEISKGKPAQVPCRIILFNHPLFKNRITDPLIDISYRRSDFIDSIYGIIQNPEANKVSTVFLYFQENLGDSLQLIDSISISKYVYGHFAFKIPTLFSAEDSVHLVVAIRPGPTTHAGDLIKARLYRIRFTAISNSFELDERQSPWAQSPIGIVVKGIGEDGVNTYRIPGMVLTNKGRLIAVYDVRRNSMWDLPGDVDVGMSYSDDIGNSWSPTKVIMHKQMDSGIYNGIGDPCILLDKSNNKIWVSALWSKGDHAYAHSGPGLSPDESGQWLLVSSKDNGISWSDLWNITSQVKNPSWELAFQGPGNGIFLKDGTLVFPAQYKDERGVPFSTILYSKDKGVSWKLGTGAFPQTTESSVAQLNDGRLLLNMRNNRGDYRTLRCTSDLGKSWDTSHLSQTSLIDPICMGSMIAFDWNGKHLVAFSNPHTQKGRSHLSIQISMDNGRNWPIILPVDDRKFFGYSSLVYLGKGRLGILYEGKRDLLFSIIQLNPKSF